MNLTARTFQEWYAYYGGEEMDVSRDDAATIWKAGRASAARDTCTWEQDDDGIYHGTCGVAWETTDGTPRDNEMNFCPRCGGKRVE